MSDDSEEASELIEDSEVDDEEEAVEALEGGSVEGGEEEGTSSGEDEQQEDEDKDEDEDEEEEEEVLSFEGMGLDSRLLHALSKKGLTTPTKVQAKCIPLALKGKDVVARARTGSGKTLAYLLPAFQKILQAADGGVAEGQAERLREAPGAVLLVPTRELCQQVKEEAASLAERCGGAVTVAQLTTGMSQGQMRAALAGPPHVVVATPGTFAGVLASGLLPGAALSRHLETLVLDEADLLLSFGYEVDIRAIAAHVPRRCQCMLMSATTSEDVDRLKRLVLHSPVTLTLMEVEGDDGGAGVSETVEQFVYRCPPTDKLLFTLALLRFELVPRKALIFVNSIEAGFRLKLFLEHFGLRTALLNAELPQNSRLHILAEFNRGLFEYLIATDDVGLVKDHDLGDEEGDEEGDAGVSASGEREGRKEGGGGKGAVAGSKKKGKRKREQDAEFGVVRGIDFKHVRTVINFDFPLVPGSYIHRVGRTGRGGSQGWALSLVAPKEEERLREVQGMVGEGVLRLFSGATKEAVESLRYRAEDVVRGVTRAVIREARAKELRMELLNSDRLKSHFEDNPRDLALLKHDKDLLKQRPATHLKHIPLYLRNPAADAASRAARAKKFRVGFGPNFQSTLKRKRKRFNKEEDPLKSISPKGHPRGGGGPRSSGGMRGGKGGGLRAKGRRPSFS